MKAFVCTALTLIGLQGVAMGNEAEKRLSRDDVTNDKELAANFDKIDANSDGYLDKMEVKAWRNAQKKEKPAE
jgi:hypothetical protein